MIRRSDLLNDVLEDQWIAFRLEMNRLQAKLNDEDAIVPLFLDDPAGKRHLVRPVDIRFTPGPRKID